jgi:hypothetical protein
MLCNVLPKSRVHLSVTELNKRFAFSLEFPVLNTIYHLQETSLGFSVYGIDVHLAHEPIVLRLIELKLECK